MSSARVPLRFDLYSSLLSGEGKKGAKQRGGNVRARMVRPRARTAWQLQRRRAVERVGVDEHVNYFCVARVADGGVAAVALARTRVVSRAFADIAGSMRGVFPAVALRAVVERLPCGALVGRELRRVARTRGGCCGVMAQCTVQRRGLPFNHEATAGRRTTPLFGLWQHHRLTVRHGVK